MKRLAHITLIAIGLAFCATAVKAETVRLVTLEYPPYQYAAGSDADGIVVRILREAFAKMNADISIDVLPWKRSLKMVETGDADAIFTAYKTAERETFLDYSKTVLMPQVVSVWVNKDNNVAFDGSMDSLSDVSIGLVDGLSYGGTVDDAIKSGVLTSLDYAPESSNNVKKLMGGRIDAVIMNKYGAMHHLKNLGGLEKVVELEPELSSVPSYIAFSKANNLAGMRDELDTVLQGMIDSGEYQSIIDTYFAQ